MSELIYWLWLSSLTMMRPKVKNRLIERFGDARSVYYASSADIESVAGINESERKMVAERSLDYAREIGDKCAEDGIGIITIKDAAYPHRLTNIYDPPILIYVRGKFPRIDEELGVAVVGTRKASAYGIKMATRMGYEITKHGGLVVSGLTEGVDSAAARGALLAGGSCVGVLGNAIDSKYSESLARDVQTVGAVISEYPPELGRFYRNFRARNRVTAGLAVATLVVEAPAKSGALLFASEATEQGKEVYAVLSAADSVTAEGSNRLIMDGARPVLHGSDIIKDFAAIFPDKVREAEGESAKMPQDREAFAVSEGMKSVESKSKATKKKGKPGADFVKLREPVTNKPNDKCEDRACIPSEEVLSKLSERQKAIVLLLGTGSMHVDEIISKSGYKTATILAELTLLQVKGIVKQEPGKLFSIR